MEPTFNALTGLELLNQFWLTLFLIIPVVLIARTVVAGTRYSPILIIVVFGLSMGFVLVQSGVATPGLSEFPMVELISRVTIIALIVSFYVGGQELRKLVSPNRPDLEEMVIPSDEEIILGTKRTQFVYLLRAFFILLGIEGLRVLFAGAHMTDPLGNFYPLIAYIGVVGSIIFIDYKAKVSNRRMYLGKGVIEIVAILLIILLSEQVRAWIEPFIGLPQIFYAMVITSTLGFFTSRWRFGPTIRSMLFAGLPVVLAATFMIGGSRMLDAFQLSGLSSVMVYGLFGQMLWMFGGLVILIALGKANHVRNLAPGMAGGLSHSGLTGACTAGDLGPEAAERAPIMINVPFLGHIFVFSILAVSVERGELLVGWSALVLVAALAILAWSIKTLRSANGREDIEIKGLMQFSLGWQVTALFGGLVLLNLSSMPLDYSVMATASALSHFGLLAAIQGNMFGAEAATLIPFIFAMPFLVHPLVFGIFGRAMEQEGRMTPIWVYITAGLGVAGTVYALFVL